jgi:hypothetical protein
MPKVFISYSHDSADHDTRVLELSDRLRGQGIDCSIDQYVTAPSVGWRAWMQQQIAEADFVLMICTETYRKRAEGKEDPSKGQGAAYEAGQIQQVLYEASGNNEKYLPVIMAATDKDNIPQDLRPFTYYRVFEPSGYEFLYRHLTGQPGTPPPPIGAITPMPPKSRGGVGNPP